MEPTPKAIALSTSVKQILEQIQLTIYQEDAFVPETSELLFTIGMADYVEFLLLPKLMQRLALIAPQIKIRVRSFNDAKESGSNKFPIYAY